MDNQEWRKALHVAAAASWLAALTLDARRGKWGAFALALALHVGAEIAGQQEPARVAGSSRRAR